MTLYQICQILQDSEVGTSIRESTWTFPAIETVHVLGLAVSVGILVMLDLRLVGVAGRQQPVSTMVNRFVPWVWWTLPILLLSGSLLIIGEPSRELLNPYFRAKMLMLLTVIIITLVVQLRNLRDSTFWESRKLLAGCAGVISLLLWVGIVTAGRWIAYY